jgi:hypothetical protein
MEQECNNIGFLVLPSIGEALELIAKQDDRKAWAAFHALYDYATKGIEPPKDAPIEISLLFTSNRALIDSARKRFNACTKNGKRGGRPKKNKKEENITEEEPEKDEPPKEENLLCEYEQNTDFSQIAKGLQEEESFIKSLWDNFKTEVQLKQKVHNDLNDLRSHFISWVKKNTTKEKTASANEVFVTMPNNESEYFAVVENSDVFNRLASMYNVSENFIFEYYKRFKEECTLTNKTHLNKEDLQSHFVRWLSIKTKQNKEQTEKAQRDKEFIEHFNFKMSKRRGYDVTATSAADYSERL